MDLLIEASYSLYRNITIPFRIVWEMFQRFIQVYVKQTHDGDVDPYYLFIAFYTGALVVFSMYQMFSFLGFATIVLVTAYGSYKAGNWLQQSCGLTENTALQNARVIAAVGLCTCSGAEIAASILCITGIVF